MDEKTSATDPFDLPPSQFVEYYNGRIAADGAADINEKIIADYRSNGGPTGIFSAAPILLLTSIGAKTGRRRTAPLVYTRDGDRYILVGSRAGSSVNPAWYHNLLANPLASIELGAERFEVLCWFADGDERDRLFSSHLAQLPGQIAGLMPQYMLKTSRKFPVVILERR